MKSKFRKLENNLYIYLFFFIYFLIGLLIYKDYGLSFDEEVHRENGFISLKYILDFFNISYDFSNVTQLISGEIPEITNDWRKTYGVAFDLPMAVLEIFIGFNDTKDVYIFRHLMTFLIFFSSTICFFYLLKLNYNSNILCLTCVLFLILSPRIFAQSFYNSRDIVFLSLIIFTSYFSLKSLNQGKIKYVILSALFASLATNTRILGCYLPVLTIFFYFLNCNHYFIIRKTLKFSFLYLFFFLFFLFISWPYLWENPLGNFVEALTEFSKYPYNPYILYLGDYIKANFVPWHYFFVWFFISTPIIFTIFIILGLFYVFKTLLLNFINISEKNSFLLWKNNNEMNEIFVLFIFLIPISLVIFLNSTLYTGWRHLYFVYPFLIFISGKGISILIKKSSLTVKKALCLLIFIQIVFVVNFLITNHPVQAVYFNFMSKKIVKDSFFYDYWGVGNKVTLNKLLSSNKYDEPIIISASSFTDLNKTKLIMEKQDRDRLIYLGIDKKKADFIFTNYYYNLPPKTDIKYSIPSNYESILKLEIGGLVINEIFKKK